MSRDDEAREIMETLEQQLDEQRLEWIFRRHAQSTRNSGFVMRHAYPQKLQQRKGFR